MPASQFVLLFPEFYPFLNHNHVHVVGHGNHALNDGGNPVICVADERKGPLYFDDTGIGSTMIKQLG